MLLPVKVYMYKIYMSLRFSGNQIINYNTHPPTLVADPPYLRVPINSAFNIGMNDFTVEWWQKMTNTYHDDPGITGDDNFFRHVFSFGYGQGPMSLGLTFEKDRLMYWSTDISPSEGNPTAIIDLSSVLVKDIWHHFAITRKGYYHTPNHITRIYLNGRQIGTNIIDNNNINPTYDLVIGNQSYNIISQYAFAGNLLGFRMINGRCLYEYPFSPPMRRPRLTEDTLLLIMGNGFTGSQGQKMINYPLNPVLLNQGDIPTGYDITEDPYIDPNIAIERVKKTPLFAGQDYSARLKRINNNTNNRIVSTYENGYYLKNTHETNSVNNALRRARAGGANVPKKITKSSNIFSN